jgi:hypothetical protein
MMSYNNRSAEILLLDIRGDLRRNRYLSSKQVRIENEHDLSHVVTDCLRKFIYLISLLEMFSCKRNSAQRFPTFCTNVLEA